MKKILAIVIVVIINFLPKVVNAQLVPCGGTDNPCKLCHLFVLLDNILDFIFIDLVPPIAILAVVIGGVYFLISVGNPSRIERAKGILTTVVIGLVIIYGSWLLINSFFMMIGVSEWTGLTDWFEYPCP